MPNTDKGRIIVTAKMVAEATHEYQQVVGDYYRHAASTAIQSAYRRYHALKKNDIAIQTSKPKFETLSEPIDDGFQAETAELIKQNQYEHIEYTHSDFTRHLFAMLRKDLITMNQMMTAKLLYESLICFNKGQIPEHPTKQFSCFQFGPDRNWHHPYSPNSISYWDGQSQQTFRTVLDNASFPQGTMRYYTINLPPHQMVAYIYNKLEKIIKNKDTLGGFNRILQKYIQTKSSDDPLLNDIYYEQDDGDTIEKIKTFILDKEPELKNFLLKTYNPSDEVQSLGMEYDLYDKESQTIDFLINLEAVNCQIPMLCNSPQYDKNNPNSPILSFIIPTIDALNALQTAVHAEETTLPVGVVGALTTRLIRAYDEPLIAKKQPAHEAITHLEKLYPSAIHLKTPSRPVELTHPDAKKTNKPHAADCHDFLLTWHDLFHAWRSGSNYKPLIRKLRHLHDQKEGFARQQDGMSLILWNLSDIDSSVGGALRGEKNNVLYKIAAIVINMRDAGYDFQKMQDNNYLFPYSVCKSPDEWSSLLFGIDPKTFDLPKDYHNITPGANKYIDNFNTIKSHKNNIARYLSTHPDASIVEIILHDLLQSSEPNDDALLLNALNRIDLKTIFYWRKDSKKKDTVYQGLYFDKRFTHILKVLSVHPRLRENSATKIRDVLRYIITSPFGKHKIVLYHALKQKLNEALYPLLSDAVHFLSTRFETDSPSQLLVKYLSQLSSDKLNDSIKNYFEHIEKEHVKVDEFIDLLHEAPPSLINTLDNDNFKKIIQFLAQTSKESEYLVEWQKKLTNTQCLKNNSLGDGRSGNPSAIKYVSLKTEEEMHRFLQHYTINPFVSKDNPVLKYQLLSTQYQCVFDIIYNNNQTTASYTRRTGPHFFHGNQSTARLTNTQLMHLMYLKRLFLHEVQALVQDSDNPLLYETIEKDVAASTHFVNFNRTRYEWFKRDLTTTRKAIIALIDEAQRTLNNKHPLN